MKVERFSPKTAALPGSLHARFVRCGKPTCRCTGGDLHGPYYRRYWRDDGHTRAEYVPLGAVDQTRQALAAWRSRHPSTRALVRELRSLWRLLAEVGDGD